MTNWVEFKTALMKNLLGEQYEFAGQHQGIDAQVASLVPQMAQATLGKLQSGQYYWTGSSGSSSTVNTLGNNSLRLTPWIVPNNITVTKLGLETTANGDVGSKIRLGIYVDNGSGTPNSLVIDAGTVAGDVTGIQEISINQYIPAGVYWTAVTVQLASSVQPTIRSANTWNPPIAVPLGTSAPGTAQTVYGFIAGSISGAYPTTLSALSLSGTSPRVFFKVA